MSQDIFKKFEKIKKIQIADKQWLHRTKMMLSSYIKYDSSILSAREESFTVKLTSFWQQITIRPAYFAISIAILLVGIVSATASSTLPGDILYSWKTGVNEKIQLALTFDKEDKITYRLNIINERFNEIVELAVSPTNNLDKIAQTQGKVNTQIYATEKNIAELESSNKNEEALKATVKLQAAIDTQKKVLSRIEGINPEKTAQIVESAQALNKTSIQLEKKAGDLNTKSSDSVVAKDDIGKEVGIKIGNAQSRLAEVSNLVFGTPNGDILTGGAKEEIQSATKSLGDAQEYLSKKDYQNAISKIQDATKSIENAESLTGVAVRISENVKSLLEQTPSATPTASPSMTPLLTTTPTASPTVPASPSATIILTPVPASSPTPATTVTPLITNTASSSKSF